MSEQNTQVGTFSKPTLNDYLKMYNERGGGNEPTDDRSVPQERKEIKLRQWKNEVACFPNEWVRSGLFSASSKILYEPDPLTNLPERIYYVKKRMPSFSDNVHLHYTGYHLNLFDLRVYLAALREGKTEYLQRNVSMTPYQFMEAAKIARCGKNKAFVYKSLERLWNGKLSSQTFDAKKTLVRFYHDHLIYKFKADKENGTWNISLSDELATMFAYQTSHINWELWNSLKGDIPRALMPHVCSHEAQPSNPQRINFLKLKELLRVDSPLHKLRPIFLKSGEQFKEKGIVKTWNCDNDILTFTRPKKA